MDETTWKPKKIKPWDATEAARINGEPYSNWTTKQQEAWSLYLKWNVGGIKLTQTELNMINVLLSDMYFTVQEV